MNALEVIAQQKGWEITQADNYLGFPTPDANNQGFIYAVEYGNCVKIGRTKNLPQRMKTLARNARNCTEIRAGRVAYSVYHTNYVKNEHTLHSFFKAKRIGKGELFSVCFEDFIQLMPKLNFEHEPPPREMKVNCGLIDALLKQHWEEMTGLPFEMWRNYEDASTSKGKEIACLAIQEAQAKQTAQSYRQYLMEIIPNITEEEIRECLDAASTMF